MPVNNADIRALFRCYLMDVASIRCTNDHRARGIGQPAALANCYNTQLSRLRAVLNVPDPLAVNLLALLPPATAFSEIKDFAYLASSVVWGLGPTWSKSWSGF